MKFDDSKTKENLVTALQGEALAHLKYQFYKSKLMDFNKGYEDLFDLIIHNEKEHGKIWFKLLHEGIVPDNELNLIDAIQGETYECFEMYEEFGRVALDEGFADISRLFFEVALIECSHAKEFKRVKKEILNDDFYKSDKLEDWKCMNCGHIVESRFAPNICPVCSHPQKYFIKQD